MSAEPPAPIFRPVPSSPPRCPSPAPRPPSSPVSYIDAGVPPPNAPLTVHGGWIRNFSSGRPVHVEGKGFNKPLYDTGELYHAFSFEVK